MPLSVVMPFVGKVTGEDGQPASFRRWCGVTLSFEQEPALPEGLGIFRVR